MRPKTGRGTLAVLRARREEILRVAAEHGGSNVRVFGSVARDEDDEKSDIDLLIDFDDKNVGGFEHFGRMEDLKRALIVLLGCQVDITDAAGLREEYAQLPSEKSTRRRILADAVPL